jgi:hypothetical protein
MKLFRAGALALLAVLAAAPTASAAVKAKVAVVRSASGVQLEVGISSKKPLTGTTRPRAVKVNSYKLKRVKSTRRSSTWRSAVQTGSAADALQALGGQRVKVKITTKRGTRTVRSPVKALPPAARPGPAPAPPPAAGPDLVRDDAAGRAAVAQDLLLEWAEFGASGRTAEYRRIWLLTDGTFRLNVIDWNDVSGESCRETRTGTWAFKEGYTTTQNGGGVVVKVTVSLSNGQSGDDVLAFPNGNPNVVYVGTQSVAYQRNPQIAQNC